MSKRVAASKVQKHRTPRLVVGRSGKPKHSDQRTFQCFHGCEVGRYEILDNKHCTLNLRLEDGACWGFRITKQTPSSFPILERPQSKCQSPAFSGSGFLLARVSGLLAFRGFRLQDLKGWSSSLFLGMMSKYGELW